MTEFSALLSHFFRCRAHHTARVLNTEAKGGISGDHLAGDRPVRSVRRRQYVIKGGSPSEL